MRFLPGFVANVAPHVDGIVALDDGSTDGTFEFLEGRPEVVRLVRVAPERPAWDEAGNYSALVAEAVKAGADWVISLDADERVERRFRVRAERAIRRGRLLGCDAFAVRLRDLWGARDRQRVDGVWGRRAPLRMFRARRSDASLDVRPLHASKVPLDARRVGRYPPLADVCVYHLRMIDPADRLKRRRRYEELDPGGRMNAGFGYEYLTDETGLELRPVDGKRGFVE
jgi:glycosyltransferase involved in cell wall biosynthesis